MGGAKAAAVRVLVVDDSSVDRKVVELLLRNHKGGAAPFHVTTVDSGKKAMELLGPKGRGKLDSSAAADANELTVDMVLTDYCMPEMTGYELLKAIKALRSPNPIPVVVMSSEKEPQRISRCLTAGAEDFIQKPLSSKDVQRLRNCSNARRPHSRQDASEARCESSSGTRRKPLAARKATSDSEKRSQSAGFAMALNNASSSELSHYFQYIFKLILLAYAVLCLRELLHRWSNGSFLSLWRCA
jgi:two-component response regulator (ARR-A family)